MIKEEKKLSARQRWIAKIPLQPVIVISKWRIVLKEDWEVDHLLSDTFSTIVISDQGMEWVKTLSIEVEMIVIHLNWEILQIIKNTFKQVKVKILNYVRNCPMYHFIKQCFEFYKKRKELNLTRIIILKKCVLLDRSEKCSSVCVYVCVNEAKNTKPSHYITFIGWSSMWHWHVKWNRSPYSR